MPNVSDMLRKQDPEVAELRRWARRGRWNLCRTRQDALRLLRKRTRLPYAFLTEARRCVQEYGGSVRDAHGLSPARQAAELLWCRIRYGLDPIAYYRYQLYREDRKADAARFMQTHDVGVVLTWLTETSTDDPGVLADKRLFERWCREHGLPAVSTLAEFENGRLAAGSGAPLPRADLFSKPSNLQGGKGAECWTYDGATWTSSGQARYTETGLIDHLARKSAKAERPILLQRRIVNHTSLRHLVKGALCTVRVATARLPRGRAQLVLAVYRMPFAASVADNFDLGGIAAPVDLPTGRLGRAMRKYPRVTGPLSMHPASGERIEGVQLPFWTETTQLALRAHDAITWSGAPVVGWDVALTDDGPLLLEGNDLPCSTLAQMPGGLPLGATPVVAAVNAHLRERFAGTGASRKAERRGVIHALLSQR